MTTRNALHSILGVLMVSCLFFSCKQQAQKEEIISLQTGAWRAVLEVQDGKKLPFLLEVLDNQQIRVFNAEETIDTEAVVIQGDSVRINFPVFEGYIAAKLQDSMTLSGSFIQESLQRSVPFIATYGVQDRFEILHAATTDMTGNWETVFSEDVPEDRYIAQGVFTQQGNMLTGTFRTTTGDYRYLEGVMNGSDFELSTFDGAHAFLFTGTATDSTMQGYFYSGSHWKEPFVAKKNPSYELPAADTLTGIKDGYDTFTFNFPDLAGQMVAATDAQFRDKVTIVQLMGSWCPNCLDESKYYTSYYKKHKGEDIAFVALAFEYAKTPEKAIKSLTRLQQKLGIEYPILLAQYGTSNKQKAQEKVPMLEKVLSYPTTIFIDKKGKVRKVHTGFNGPATGEKYITFKREFESFVAQLLKES